MVGSIVLKLVSQRWMLPKPSMLLDWGIQRTPATEHAASAGAAVAVRTQEGKACAAAV